MNIVEIEYGDYQAKINVSRGANCIALRNRKYGAIILREPDYSRGLDDPYLYGMPILFPVNRISGAQFTFEGRIYRFPVNEPQTGTFLHGMLHETPFTVEKITRDSICCIYEATRQNPYLEFPHAFRLMIKYTLDENGLHQDVSFKNLSEWNMPLLLGFHTTFQIPFLPGGRKAGTLIQADVSEEYERDSLFRLPTGRILDKDRITEQLNEGQFVPYGQKLSRHYRCGGSGDLRIMDVDSGMFVVYKNSLEYAYRLIYNGEADDYICLEPQTCLVDCVNQQSPYEAGLISLSPNEEKCFHSFIGLVHA